MIVAGIGCRAGCSATDIVAAVRAAAARDGVALGDVVGLYSADFKAREQGLQHAAEALEKPLRFLPAAALAARAADARTVSSAVVHRFSLPSVAETAALAGALELGGRQGRARLLSARCVAGGAVCALAQLEAES